MKKQFLTVLSLLVSAMTLCNAQNEVSGNNIQNKSIRIGYGVMGGSFATGQAILNNSTTGYGSLLNVSADLFRVTNSISIGAHVGIGQAATQESLELPTLMQNTIGLHYGIGLSYNILNNAGFASDKWDLRLNANIGGYRVHWVGSQLEYGAGISATYYMFKHFGIYADMMWGRFLYNGNGNSHLGEGHSKIELGVSYRF